jgi:hypothetical protein
MSRRPRPLSARERAEARHERDRQRREQREAKRLADALTGVTPGTTSAQNRPYAPPAPTTPPVPPEGSSGAQGGQSGPSGSEAPVRSPGVENDLANVAKSNDLANVAESFPAEPSRPRPRHRPRCWHCQLPVEIADLVWVAQPTPASTAACHRSCRRADDRSGWVLGAKTEAETAEGEARRRALVDAGKAEDKAEHRSDRLATAPKR